MIWKGIMVFAVVALLVLVMAAVIAMALEESERNEE